MSITLRVEALAGTSIEEALAEMISLRQRLGIDIQAKFNGVELFVCRDDQTIEEMTQEYLQELCASHDVNKEGE